jgi:ribonuclease Y
MAGEVPVEIFSAIGGMGVGLAVYHVLTSLRVKRAKETAEEQSRLIIDKAHIESEGIIRDSKLKAKEEKLNAQKELDREMKERRSELKQLENKVTQKETRLERKFDEIEKKEKTLEEKNREIDKTRSEVDGLRDEYVTRLESVGEMSKQEAKEVLLAKVDEDFRYDIELRMKSVVESCRETAKEESLNVISQAIQKAAVDYKSEGLVSVIDLPNEEMKGRIIGREGRNIRAFENVTGVDVIIDDTPDVVVLSGFNAFKKVCAARTMQRLVEDGRIHPARIEEVYIQVCKEVDDECIKAGEEAALRVGVHRLKKEITRELGKLKFRTSYGQNVLEHSIECAHICSLLASEIGANTKIAKRAALLHDIGKVIDGDEASHAKLGAEMARKCGEKSIIVNAIASHHEEIPMEHPISFLVTAADAISASRRGARIGQSETYVERLENLERIAVEFDGVESAFAVQAGREVRVMVNPEKVDDTLGIKLSHDIVKKIEDELDYPGQIKVVVVRENRFVDYAF